MESVYFIFGSDRTKLKKVTVHKDADFPHSAINCLRKPSCTALAENNFFFSWPTLTTSYLPLSDKITR